MNRRDLLKMIGIGGVGAVANVVSGKEVEAAPVQPVEPRVQDHIDYLNALYVGDAPSAIIGSTCFYPATTNASYRRSLGQSQLYPSVTISGPGLIDAHIEGYRRVDDFGGDE